jgi:hypothetical protein
VVKSDPEIHGALFAHRIGASKAGNEMVMFEEVVGSVAGLLALATVVVFCSGNFSSRDQTWSMVLWVAAGIVGFLLLLGLLYRWPGLFVLLAIIAMTSGKR